MDKRFGLLTMKHKAIYDTRFFFATAPLPCPYLPDRVERRVVTELMGRDAAALHDRLSLAGFRRSHGIVYAPACAGCQECIAVRVLAQEFKPSRSHRRILGLNRGVLAEETHLVATEEQYRLFSSYQKCRHTGGDMANMSYSDYQALIEETPVNTFLYEYRDPDGSLIAVCLADRVVHGLSAVYSFFDPELRKRSLGTFIILQLNSQARHLGLDHVYLGYWIEGCAKMSYKGRFRPLEAKTPKGWVRFEAP